MAFYSVLDARLKIIRKTADQTVNNSDVLVNDDDLKFYIGANQVWAFELIFIGDSGATPDFKLTFVVPAGCTGKWWAGTNAVTTDYISAAKAFATTATKDGYGAPNYYGLYGLAINGATGGDVQLQWAQNTANASDTTIKETSYIIARRLK